MADESFQEFRSPHQRPPRARPLEGHPRRARSDARTAAEPLARRDPAASPDTAPPRRRARAARERPYRSFHDKPPAAPSTERREPRIFETWEGNDVRAPPPPTRYPSPACFQIPRPSPVDAPPGRSNDRSDLPSPAPINHPSRWNAAIFLRRRMHDRPVPRVARGHVRARPRPVRGVQRPGRPGRRVEVLARVHRRRNRVAAVVPLVPSRGWYRGPEYRSQGTVPSAPGWPREGEYREERLPNGKSVTVKWNDTCNLYQPPEGAPLQRQRRLHRQVRPPLPLGGHHHRPAQLPALPRVRLRNRDPVRLRHRHVRAADKDQVRRAPGGDAVGGT